MPAKRILNSNLFRVEKIKDSEIDMKKIKNKTDIFFLVYKYSLKFSVKLFLIIKKKTNIILKIIKFLKSIA